MGAILAIIGTVGGTMAGLGANITAQGFMMEYGMKYASNKFTKACVGCASWAVGCYASKKTSEIFATEYGEAVDAIEGIKEMFTKKKDPEDTKPSSTKQMFDALDESMEAMDRLQKEREEALRRYEEMEQEDEDADE